MIHFYLSKINIVTDDRNDLTSTVADSEGYEYTHESEVTEDELLRMYHAIDENIKNLTENIYGTP